MHIDGLVQDCSISIANALEILQSCTKPSIYASSGLDELTWITHIRRWYFTGTDCRKTTTANSWDVVCTWPHIIRRAHTRVTKNNMILYTFTPNSHQQTFHQICTQVTCRRIRMLIESGYFIGIHRWYTAYKVGCLILIWNRYLKINGIIAVQT